MDADQLPVLASGIFVCTLLAAVSHIWIPAEAVNRYDGSVGNGYTSLRTAVDSTVGLHVYSENAEQCGLGFENGCFSGVGGSSWDARIDWSRLKKGDIIFEISKFPMGGS